MSGDTEGVHVILRGSRDTVGGHVILRGGGMWCCSDKLLSMQYEVLKMSLRPEFRYKLKRKSSSSKVQT